jgi:signal peptide peptidase SppA
MSSTDTIRTIGATPWAIQPTTLDALVAFLGSGQEVTRKTAAARIGGARAPARSSSPAAGVMVIPVYGIITQHSGQVDDFWGMVGTSTESIGAMFDVAIAHQDVGTVVLDIDSPGGTVYGVPELAAKIYAARGKGKRIVAVADSLAASAAWWLASQADEVVASPSAEVGSIGVYSAHIDTTGAQEQAGFKVTVISAGRFKAEGALGQPLTDAAKAAEQARVDTMYGMFVADVARGRGVDSMRVRTGYGEGRIVGAKAALAAGMVDRVATVQETIGRYVGRAGGRGGASADFRRRELALADAPTGANADTLKKKLALNVAVAAMQTGTSAEARRRELGLGNADTEKKKLALRMAKGGR